MTKENMIYLIKRYPGLKFKHWLFEDGEYLVSMDDGSVRDEKGNYFEDWEENNDYNGLRMRNDTMWLDGWTFLNNDSFILTYDIKNHINFAIFKEYIDNIYQLYNEALKKCSHSILYLNLCMEQCKASKISINVSFTGPVPSEYKNFLGIELFDNEIYFTSDYVIRTQHHYFRLSIELLEILVKIKESLIHTIIFIDKVTEYKNNHPTIVKI